MRAFGYWSLPSENTEMERWLEEQLERAFDFYKEEVEQRGRRPKPNITFRPVTVHTFYRIAGRIFLPEIPYADKHASDTAAKSASSSRAHAMQERGVS